MNHDERDALLTAYLADELDDAGRKRFESMMGNDADLAAEAESLRRTVQAMRSLDQPARDGRGGQANEDAPLVIVRPLRLWVGAVVRYAAVIGLAFAAGYILRGGGEGALNDGPSAGVVSSAEGSADGAGTAMPVRPESSQWLQRVGEVYITRQGGSSFARSLVAIAEAGGKE